MPEDRAARLAQMPDDMKNFVKALTEVNKVLSGGNTDPDHAFNEADVWGSAAVDSAGILPYMQARQADQKLKDEIAALYEGVVDTSKSSVLDMVTKVRTAVEEYIQKFLSTASELADTASAKFTAVKRLIGPHPESAEYDYKPYGSTWSSDKNSGNYGLMPAVEAIFTSDAQAKQDAATAFAAIDKVTSIIDTGTDTADVVAYATGTLDFLTKTLTNS